MATSRAAPADRQGLHAYVLHRWDWSESSLIVELFTRSLGRITVAARGAKRASSDLRAVLMPFHPVMVGLTQPRRKAAAATAAAGGLSGDGGAEAGDPQTEVQTLKHAEWAGGAALLPASALISAFYLNELVLKMLPRQDPHPALFDGYAQALGALAAPGVREGTEAPVLRAFELLLLREAGLLPALHEDTQLARALDPSAAYTLKPEGGLVAVQREARPAQHPVSGQGWRVLEAALAGGSFAALQAACEPVAAGLRGPLRQLLHYHLATPTLRTREVWREVQRLHGGATPALRDTALQ